MIVLEIILIILIVIVLLLSLPVDIKANYDLPKPSKKSPPKSQPNEYVPDSDDPDTMYVVSYLKDNGLWPTPPEPKEEKIFSLVISYMFFRFTVFPMKDSSTKTKKEKIELEKEKKEKKEKPKKEAKSDWNLNDIFALWEKIKPKVLKLSKTIFNNLRFHHVKIKVVLSSDDTAQTALKFAHMNQALYSVLPILLNYVKIRFTKIQIKPDFFSEYNDFSGQFSLRFNPIVLLTATLGFGLNLLLVMKNVNSVTKKKM